MKGFIKKISNTDFIYAKISLIWLLFFFGMFWLSLGIMAYGLIFQWVFKLFLADYLEYHLPVFMILWSVYGLYEFNKTKEDPQP